MHMSEILKAELDAFRERTGRAHLDILETGTIRGAGENYHRGDGWSTVTFAEYVKANGGSVTSIDLEIDTAVQVLKAHRLATHVKLVKGSSVEVIEEMAGKKGRSPRGSLDVAFLDSGNDAALTLREYLTVAPLMRSPGLVMVDDVDMNSHEVVKGHEIVPFIQAHGIAHRIIQRDGDGFTTGVLVFEV